MKHLKLVDESYLRHMAEAWLITATFILAGVICFIHSIFPFLFQTTASTMIKKVISRTDERQKTLD